MLLICSLEFHRVRLQTVQAAAPAVGLDSEPKYQLVCGQGPPSEVVDSEDKVNTIGFPSDLCPVLTE